MPSREIDEKIDCCPQQYVAEWIVVLHGLSSPEIGDDLPGLLEESLAGKEKPVFNVGDLMDKLAGKYGC